jgi:hypothetical protein
MPLRDRLCTLDLVYNRKIESYNAQLGSSCHLELERPGQVRTKVVVDG